MKKIDIPEPQLMTVQLEDGKTTKREVDFKTFVEQIWMSDPRWGNNIETLMLCERIKNRVRVSNGHLFLEDEELEALKQVAANPKHSYLPHDSKPITLFYAALMDAKDNE